MPWLLAIAAALLSACPAPRALGTFIVDVFIASGDNRTEHGGAEPLQVAVNDINAAGGVRGQQVELFLHDTGGRPDKAAQEAVAVRDLGVRAIFTVPSDVTIPVLQAVTIPSGVFVMATGSASDAITVEWARRSGGNLARTSLRGSGGAKRLARVAWDDGARRIGVICGGDDFGVEFCDAFVAAFRALGGEITGDPPAAQVFPAGALQDTYQAELLAAMDGASAVGGQAAVMVATCPSAFKVLLRDAKASALSIRWYGAHTVRARGVLDESPEAAAGMRGVAPARGKPANYAAYEASFQAAFPQGDPAAIWYAHAYDAMIVYGLAVARTSGELTSDKVKANLRKVANGGLGKEVVGPANLLEAFQLVEAGSDVDYQGASGVVDFNNLGDVIGGWADYEVRGSDFVDLTP